jgi:hypothetical protein
MKILEQKNVREFIKRIINSQRDLLGVVGRIILDHQREIFGVGRRVIREPKVLITPVSLVVGTYATHKKTRE